MLALLMLGFITLSAALPYIPSLRYGFVYDDDVQVFDAITALNWQSPYTYFASSVWNPLRSASLNPTYYRPLFYFWMHVNAALFGYKAFYWHLAAVALHLAATILVFFLLRRYFESPWIALVGALIFGVHPVHIESVAWVSGATDPLAAIGILASLLLWLKATDACRDPIVPSAVHQANIRVSRLQKAAALLCYAAALMAKETAVIFPAIIFVYAFAGLGTSADKIAATTSPSRRLRFAVIETLPYVGLAGIYLALRTIALHPSPSRSPWISRLEVLLTAPSLLLFYLRHLVWPFRLHLFYDFHVIRRPGDASFWLSLLLLGAIAGGAFWLWHRIRWHGIPAAGLWILLPLLPVLDIALFQQDDFLHDRYLYFPSLGVAIVGGFLTQKIWGSGKAPRRRLIAFGSVTFVLALLAGSTALQSAPWQDNLALYTASVRSTASNTMARNNLAGELVRRDQLEQARTILQNLIQQRPDFWLANYNLGYVQYRLKNLDQAETSLRRAMSLNPSDPDTHCYLGLTLFREGRLSDAQAQLRQAIVLKPAGAGYHFGLGMVELRQGRHEEAQAEFSAELKYHPENQLARILIPAAQK
jgi:Tfp pilus assembly protein PilF